MSFHDLNIKNLNFNLIVNQLRFHVHIDLNHDLTPNHQ